MSDSSRGINLLHTLVSMVNVAELMNSKLEELNEFTIITPALPSFDKLSRGELLEILADKDALNSIISKHIIPSKINYEDLEDGILNEVKTVDGETVKLQKNEDNKIMVSSNFGNATVLSTNSIGSNGIVHVVDNVI